MITEADIYWLTRMDGLKVMAFLLPILGGFLSAVLAVNLADEKHPAWKVFAILFALCVLLLPVGVFIPTTKQMAAIKIIPLIARDEQVQELPGKVVDLADEWLEELRPKKDE